MYKLHEAMIQGLGNMASSPVITNTANSAPMYTVLYTVLLHNVDAHNVNVTGRVCYCPQRKHTKHKSVKT